MIKLKKFVLALLIPIIILPLAGVLYLSRAQAIHLITHPRSERPSIDRTPADLGIPFEEVRVTSEDGFELVGWFIVPQNGAVIIAQHGYKGNRTSMLEEAQILHNHGYGVLVSTVRAHDRSEGETITFGVNEMQDLEAWYQYLLRRAEVDPRKIGIMGNSLGASMAIQYAAQNEEIKAVVAQSAFSSLDDTISTTIEVFTGLPAFPFAPLIVFWAEFELGEDSSQIDAKAWIAQLSPRPVLLLHGGKDIAIDKDSAVRLFQAAGEPKELWYEPEFGHAEFDTALPEEFEQRVVDFFDRYLLEE